MRLNLRFSYKFAAKAELGGKSSNLLYFFIFIFSVLPREVRPAPFHLRSCRLPRLLYDLLYTYIRSLRHGRDGDNIYFRPYR